MLTSLRLPILVLAFSLFSFSVLAQIDSLVNSGWAIQYSAQLSDSGNYELAIRQLQRIDPRDTNYYYSLAELADAYYNNKQYAESIKACEQGLANPSEHRVALYNAMARALTAQEKFAQASAVVTKGLDEFPLDFSLVFRQGLIYSQEKRYPEAEEQFFKAIDLAPYLSGAHLNLAKMAMRRGNKVEGMLAMGIYLAINNTANEQLQLLEHFVKNEITDENTIDPNPEYPFGRLDEIIRSKISFDPGYKTKIGIDAGIVKQYQLLFEQINNQTYPANDPWVKFYLTIYRDLIKSKMQEAFVYHLLESAPIKDVSQWKEKNKKLMQQFYEVTNASLTQFRVKRTLPQKWGYSGPVACSYYKDGHIESIGDKDEKGNRVGKWYYFASNGAKEAEGNYKLNGKTGVWNYFNTSGIRISVEDESTGDIKSSYVDGSMRSHYTLKEKRMEGTYELFYRCGALEEKRNYVQGKRDGAGKRYYPDGKVSAEFAFKSDSLNGPYIEWYVSGTKMSEQTYDNGKNIGKYTGYHPNGKIKTVGNYLNGKANGEFLYYHENGKLRKKGSYKNDEVTGIWESYDKNGLITEKRNYTAQASFDEEENYYHQGKLHYTVKTKNDLVVSFVYYDQSGKQLTSLENAAGTFKGKGYFPTGEVRLELEYRNGLRSGVWKYYSRYGNLETKCEYAEGKLKGEYLDYYNSGILKMKVNYSDGEQEGLYLDYNKNGSLETSGWFTHGLKQQKWLTYHFDGRIKSDTYYLNDDQVGYQSNFAEDGKLMYRIDVDDVGKVKMLTEYDENGTVVSQPVTTENHQMIVTQKYKSGNVAQQSGFRCGEWDGVNRIMLSNGKLYKEDRFINGDMDGKYTSYSSDGRVAGRGMNVAGVANSTWTWLDANGSKDSEGKYYNGDRDSTWNYFYSDGKISSSVNYDEDKRNGDFQLFDPAGKVILYKKYDDGDLVSYRTYGKDGKLSDWIPFKGNDHIVSYFPTGIIAVSEFYRNGEYDSVRTFNYPSGKPFNEFRYNKNLSEGPSTEYYADGKLKEKRIYTADYPTGVWEYYDVKGNLIRKETYAVGSLNGKVEYFADGKSVGSQRFWGGYPVD